MIAVLLDGKIEVRVDGKLIALFRFEIRDGVVAG